MDSELAAPRSRRALLTAAAAAGGALVASAALPMAALAHDAEDVQKGVDNATTATTSITDSGAASTAFSGRATGAADVDGVAGAGLEGTSAAGAGLFAWSISAPGGSFDRSFLSYTGIYGFAPAGDGITTVGTGVWGDSGDTGVYGTGYLGVLGSGSIGAVGEVADGVDGGIGLVGDGSGSTASIGVLAFGDPSGTALHVEGKVHFSRSGRVAMSAGKSSKAVTLVGGTGGTKVFAVLSTSETGRYVRAVVPATGKFTIYLNTTLATAAVVSWFALD
jgi:hypothetical protein